MEKQTKYERKLKGDNQMLYRTVVDHTVPGMGNDSEADVRLKIASTMIDRDYPVAEIAKITGLSIDDVEELK
ncbi:hypothetical protein NE570_08935 [Eubacterium callanderi]|nr:hypothetical protein [Eubacterium callanderi]